jgi:hypothetical protein
LVPSNPRGAGQVPLLDNLLIDHRGDLLLWQCVDAGQQVFKLRGMNHRQHLGTPQWLVGFGQLLANRNGENGWNGGGGRWQRRGAHRGAIGRQKLFACSMW